MSILQEKTAHVLKDEESMQAFRRLETARAEIQQYLPEDFDPDKELREAREKRYSKNMFPLS